VNRVAFAARPLGAALALLVSMAAPGRAQEAPQGWPGLTVPELPVIYVLDDAGLETSGRLLRLNPDSIVLFEGGVERRVEANRVVRIQKRGDSLRNGAIIGAIAGVALGTLTAGIADCPDGDRGGGCLGSRTVLFAVSTAMYAAIGTAIDALVPGRTTFYEVRRPR
jgi:hypothetical protein